MAVVSPPKIPMKWGQHNSEMPLPGSERHTEPPGANAVRTAGCPRNPPGSAVQLPASPSCSPARQCWVSSSPGRRPSGKAMGATDSRLRHSPSWHCVPQAGPAMVSLPHLQQHLDAAPQVFSEHVGVEGLDLPLEEPPGVAIRCLPGLGHLLLAGALGEQGGGTAHWPGGHCPCPHPSALGTKELHLPLTQLLAEPGFKHGVHGELLLHQKMADFGLSASTPLVSQ